MRIAFIGQKGIPAKFGGVEKHVEELAKRLVGLGHEVFVYTRPNYTDKRLTEYAGVKLISIPSLPTKNLDAISHTFFACLDLWLRKVDIVHFHSIGPSSLIGLVKILKPRTPVVATFHTQCYFHQKWGSFARWYLKLGEQSICHLPDRTITVSKTLTDYTKKKHNCESFYVPNGVSEPVVESPLEIKKFGLKHKGYILTVSRLVRHKGVHYLIKAYKQLKTDKKLVIVGDGAFTDDYVHELNELASENENIIFTGNQTGRTLNELFSHAYTFVQPSESEGLSIALLEAMSHGLPIVASNIPENMEVIQNTGVSFRNKNVADLKRKLAYMIDNPQVARRLGRQARLRTMDEYQWDNIVDNIGQIYESVLA